MQVMKINDIKTNPNNPRLIKDDKFANLVKSVKDFPEMLELRPIVVNKDMIILWGNMRYKACKEAWLKEIPVIVADNLTEEQEREFLIKDNVSGGEWDWDILANEWDKEELEEWWLDVQFETVEPEAEEDDFEVDEGINTDIVLWDLFEIWPHRLLCWDSTNIDDVNKLMNGEKADMVFTDPPYWVSYQSNMRTKSDKFDVLENDNVFITEWINNLPIFSKWFVFVWTSWKVLKQWIEFCEPIGELSNIIIWDKWGWWIWDLKKTFLTDFEVALCYNRWAEITGKRLWSVWSVGKDWASKYLHPTQKPVWLSALAIENVSNKNNIVLDLFWWSGSTMVACHQLGRKCYMSELDPKYVQTIINRMIKLDSTLEIKRNWQPYLIPEISG